MGISMTAGLSRRTLLKTIATILCFFDHPGFAMRAADAALITNMMVGFF
jgi:hypothetical protein